MQLNKLQVPNLKSKISALLLSLGLFLSGFAYGQEVSLDRLMGHIQTLCSSDYGGRLAGTQKYMDAAEYVATELKSYGIESYDEDWNQLFEVECNEVENCTFNTYVNANDVRTVYVLGRDFVCGSMTGRGYADANVVFCGYGIDAAAFNEYADVDARGKIVMVVSGVPSFLPSHITDSYTSLRDKARVAKDHGAVALVVVNRAENCRRNEVQSANYCGQGPHLATFPVVQPTFECGELLLEGEKQSIDSTLALIAQTQKPQSFHLLKKFEIDVNAKYHPRAVTANVVGVLKGFDRKMRDEIVIVGANLDHIGMQGKTCLFPGADDNASGVAALLETAKLLAESPMKPKRTFVFVVFSGAEVQHLGAQVFLSNFDKQHKVEAYIGAEHIGNGDSIVALGNNRFPALWEVANHNDTTSNIRMLAHGIKANPKGNAGPFAAMGIPSLVFSTLNGNRYAHVPSDKPENINRTLLVQATQLMYQTLKELGDGDYRGRDRKTMKKRQ